MNWRLRLKPFVPVCSEYRTQRRLSDCRANTNKSRTLCCSRTQPSQTGVVRNFPWQFSLGSPTSREHGWLSTYQSTTHTHTHRQTGGQANVRFSSRANTWTEHDNLSVWWGQTGRTLTDSSFWFGVVFNSNPQKCCLQSGRKWCN